jgi:4-amino-4-deoxychorismate lyase
MLMLLETIAIYKGIPLNLARHQARMNATFLHVYQTNCLFDLEIIFQNFTSLNNQDWVRCRFVYNAERYEIQLFPYIYKTFSKIKMVDIPSQYNYQHKWNDRQYFAKLLEENPDFEEVLMIQNGFVTDLTIGNIAFFDGNNWFCPDTPLLKGTQRAYLLEKKLIEEKPIKVNDLHQFQRLIILNVFRNLDLDKSLLMNVLH